LNGSLVVCDAARSSVIAPGGSSKARRLNRRTPALSASPNERRFGASAPGVLSALGTASWSSDSRPTYLLGVDVHKRKDNMRGASISVTPPTPIRFGWFWAAGRLPWCIGTPPRPVGPSGRGGERQPRRTAALDVAISKQVQPDQDSHYFFV
jgi:hypothetical protein